MPEDNHRTEPDPKQLRKIWKTHLERWKLVVNNIDLAHVPHMCYFMSKNTKEV